MFEFGSSTLFRDKSSICLKSLKGCKSTEVLYSTLLPESWSSGTVTHQLLDIRKRHGNQIARFRCRSFLTETEMALDGSSRNEVTPISRCRAGCSSGVGCAKLPVRRLPSMPGWIGQTAPFLLPGCVNLGMPMCCLHRRGLRPITGLISLIRLEDARDRYPL
jgi:hypothetical protein